MPHGPRAWQLAFGLAACARVTAPRWAAAALACIAIRAQADELPDVGHGASALPAVDGVGVLSDMRAPVSASATLGYGLTESVIGDDDVHHRTAMLIGASFAPQPWIGLAARIDGRYDAHSGGAEDGEVGFVGQTQLRARTLLAASAPLRVGGELGVRFPGASDVERGLSATSAELQALATLAPRDSAFWLSALFGFRLDRARDGVADPDRLSLSDRVALGASDWNALLLGLAVSRRLGALDLLGEWSWDVQVGSAAPSAWQSPMRISAGARYFPSGSLHVQMLAGVSPSARPEVEAQGPLHVIEPRFWITAGVGLYFARASGSTAHKPAARSHAAAPSTARAPVTGSLRGRVVDAAGGAPLAHVHVEIDGRAPAVSDAQGYFAFEGVLPGAVRLRARAPGFREQVSSTTVTAGQSAQVEIAIERELPEGQIRGSVRSLEGRPLAARIRVEPLGKVVQPDAQGNFELDVAPGEYTIEVSAPGYQTQQRLALVERNGVTVILVELSRAR